MKLRVHDSALKHGCSREDISHAIDMALYVIEIGPDNDPPKVLYIGPDPAANLLEVIGGGIADNVFLVWHAKRCCTQYLELLPPTGGDQ